MAASRIVREIRAGRGKTRKKRIEIKDAFLMYSFHEKINARYIVLTSKEIKKNKQNYNKQWPTKLFNYRKYSNHLPSLYGGDILDQHYTYIHFTPSLQLPLLHHCYTFQTLLEVSRLRKHRLVKYQPFMASLYLFFDI